MVSCFSYMQLFSVLSQEIAGKNVSEITYFVSGATENLNWVNLCMHVAASY